MGSHKTHRVESNSLLAYQELKRHESLAMRNRQIILAYATIGLPATDRQVMKKLGFVDANLVRPRITEMLDAGILSHIGNVICPTTGKRVRACQIKQEEQFDTGI